MRVGIVCEGRTDFVLLEHVVLSVFGPCEIDPVQPMRDALDPTRWQAGGWTFVKAWCEARDATQIEDEMTLGQMDALVVQVDGDLCGRDGLPATRGGLCARIREAWLGGGTLPAGVVICIPAMATDTWLWAALSPDPLPAEMESEPAPVERLGTRGVGKNQYSYRAHGSELAARVPAIRHALPELDRFVGKLERIPASK